MKIYQELKIKLKTIEWLINRMNAAMYLISNHKVLGGGGESRRI